MFLVNIKTTTVLVVPGKAVAPEKHTLFLLGGQGGLPSQYGDVGLFRRPFRRLNPMRHNAPLRPIRVVYPLSRGAVIGRPARAHTGRRHAETSVCHQVLIDGAVVFVDCGRDPLKHDVLSTLIEHLFGGWRWHSHIHRSEAGAAVTRGLDLGLLAKAQIQQRLLLIAHGRIIYLLNLQSDSVQS